MSGKFFTGPFARQILDPRNGGESQSEKEKWKVFVLLERNKQGLILQKNSEVLYQVCIHNIIGLFFNIMNTCMHGE